MAFEVKKVPLPEGWKDSTLAGKSVTEAYPLANMYVVKTSKEGDSPIYKAVFSSDGTMRMEGNVLIGFEKEPVKRRLFVEVRGNVVEWGSMSHAPQFSFITNKELGFAKSDVKISPPTVQKLSGELGSDIRKAFNEIGAYLETREELKKKMAPGETFAEGLVIGKGFPAKETPSIFITVEDGKITQLGIVGKQFYFVPSKEGEMKYPAVVVSGRALEKLSNTEPGVVMGMVFKEIPTYVPKVEGLLKNLREVESHPEIRKWFAEETMKKLESDKEKTFKNVPPLH